MSTWNRKTHPFRIVRTYTHPKLRWTNHTETFMTWADLKAAALAPMSGGCFEVRLDKTTDDAAGGQGPWLQLGSRKIKKPLKLTAAGREHDKAVV